MNTKSTFCGGTCLLQYMIAPMSAAVCAMGLAGEIAESRMQPGDGNSTYGDRLIDAISNMDGATLDKGAKYELL